MQSNSVSASGSETRNREDHNTLQAELSSIIPAYINKTHPPTSQLDFTTMSTPVSSVAVPLHAHSHYPPIRQHSSENTEYIPPNGGTEAYLKVAGGFCTFFITLGVASTFGSYQAYYESTLLKTSSSSTISWIGTTQVFLLSFVGTFSGVFFDWGYERFVLATGLLLIVLGLMMLSLAEGYWQILLSQGVCVGIGSGLVYVPAVSVISNEFTTKRAVALGFAATGTAVGGIILPVMFRKLLPQLGWGWTNRTLAFIVLIFALIAFALLTDICRLPSGDANFRLRRRQQTQQQNNSRATSSAAVHPRTPCQKMRPLLAALKGRAYLYLCIGVFFVFLGYWVPLFYIVPFASVSLGASSSYASYLLSILNAGSFFGRVLPAYLSQIVGTASVLFVGALSLGVIVFAWLGIGNLPGISVWCFLVGFSSDIVVSIPNAVASRLSNPSNVGLRIGAMWTAGAFAELIGAPIAGALVRHDPEDEQNVSYKGGQVFGGLAILVGAAFLIVPAWSILKEDRIKAARMQ